MFLDLGAKDRATVKRSIEQHEKKLDEAIKRVQLLERSDMDLKTEQGRLEILKKDFELKAQGTGPIDTITMQLTHPLRMCLGTGLRILRYEARKLGDRSELLLGTNEEAEREIDHIDRLLGAIGEQTALELGYVAERASEKPAKITQEGVADIRAAVEQGIEEGKWGPEPAAKRKKRERAVVKESKKRERDVLNENRNIHREAP